jgi:hypothetical protein
MTWVGGRFFVCVLIEAERFVLAGGTGDQEEVNIPDALGGRV